MKPVLAVYLRVSSRIQDTASQEPDMKRWLGSNLDVLREDVEVKWYKDKFTGKTMDRPGWNRLHKDILEGRVKKVVIWRLDRLGRTASGLTALFDELVRLKVGLVSIKDGLDLETPAGRLMANVLASVSQFETEVRSERITAGLEVAREKGVALGRKPGTHTRIKVTSEQESIVRRLKDEGESVAAIARTVGLSRPTVYTLLN